MKNTIALLLCMAFAMTACLAAPASPAETASTLGELDFSRTQPALQITRGTPEHTRIFLTSPPILQKDSLVDFRSYRVYAMDGEPFEWIDGRPAIPQVTRLYHIPNTGSVDLVVNHSGFELVDNVDVLPTQVETRRFPTDLYKDPTVYSTDGWYPAQPAVMSAPMIYRDFRVVQVTLYPVQLNPRLRQVRVYQDVSAEIVANSTPGENELLNPRQPSGAFAALYRAHISNLDERALDDISTSPGSYLILCKNNAIPLQWADTLATWKRRMGYSVTIDARTTWNYNTMRSAVVNQYSNTNPPLEFVCIMGDPQASFGMPTDGSYYDHNLASLTADDIEDIGVGRLPASSSAEFNTILAKILAYERTPYMTDPSWFGRAFFYAGLASSFTSNAITMRWAKQQFVQHTGVQTVNVLTHNGNVNTTTVANQLNAGVSYFLWRGTVVGEMGTDCATNSALNNGSKLPVVLTITCGTGDFNTGLCISESWILAGNASSMKGGVCGIGTATYGTHVQYNNTVTGGLVYNICNLGVEHLGLALAGAKAQLYAAFPSGSASDFTRWNNLMGEPSLSLWTQQPVVMNVTYPGTVNVGARRIRPQVIDAATSTPIEGARVVLWKGTECFAMANSDEFGFADVPVTVLTPGTMTLTVSKRNHKPFLANITCVSASQMVTYTSFTIDDDNTGGTFGNANGVINPGETIDLPIHLRNFGTSQTATSVTATLTGNHPGITIINGTQNYPNVAPGDSALSASPFRITIAPTVKHGTNTVLTLAVTATGDLTHSSLPITIKAGEPIFETCQVTGGNGNQVLEPGESAGLRLTVRNVGELALEAVTGQLVSNSQYATVTSGTSAYGTIPVGGTANNTGQEFQVHANVHTYPGHMAALMAIFSTANGYLDTVRFSVTVGTRATTDPTGPDEYGYFAYENTDVGYELSRPYSYININSGLGTNLNLSDPGEQQPSNPIYSVVRTLPFTFRFYGQDYTQITVCSNGWAAFGDQHELDMFRNYPIPGQQAPDAMIAPFWDDLKTSTTGLGVWDYADADSHRYVIQWRARGAVNSNLQDFEIILLDPLYYPTHDGNGMVVVQYSSVAEMVGDYNDVKYSTIGIQAPGGLVGLQYRFNNVAALGASSLVAGRSVLYTTECYAAFGDITGIVTDADTQAPMAGVLVSVDGTSENDTTDANGSYFLNNVLAGTYTIRAATFGFNDGVAENVVVEMDSTETINFSMLHPEIALSVNQIAVTLPDNPATTYFDLINDGNGPLDYQVKIEYDASGTLDERWDYLAGIDVTGATGDQLIQGCEFIGDYWYVSGGGSSHKFLYKFDLSGNYVGSIPQPSDDGLGWFDMAFDGNYIYGSNSSQIVGIDLNGTVQTTLASPMNPTRALAYDPQTDHFWVADYTTEISEISRDGTIVRHFVAPGAVTGLSWNSQDTDGYRLYVFCQDSIGRHSRVYRTHLISGHTQFLVQLDQQSNDRSGGCTITSGWNSTMLVFGGILQNTPNDHLGIWELDFNTSWISITPMFGSVPGNTSRQMEVTFNPAGLRNATYRVNLIFENNSVSQDVRLPVALTVSLDAETPQTLPLDYRLDQNFPNPFNGRTTFRYQLKQPGYTTLRLFNLLGQEVTTVVNGLQTAGTHTINFDMDDLPSGVYVYRLESGDFRAACRLVLLR